MRKVKVDVSVYEEQYPCTCICRSDTGAHTIDEMMMRRLEKARSLVDSIEREILAKCNVTIEY
jgi:hypothetical protein